MKTKDHWRYWLVAVGIAIGAVLAFWPQLLTAPPTGPSSGKDTNENDIHEVSNGADVTEYLLSTEGKTEISTDVDAAAEGELLNEQAMNAWRSGEIREAMDLFERAIEAAPDNPAPHSNYGRLLTLMVSYQQALPLLERARALTPNDAQAWLDLATLYERAQVLEKSWEARAEAAKLVGADAIMRDEQGRFIVQGVVL